MRAIAHKDYNTHGGGEHVAEHLAETFSAPLFVGHENRENQPEDMDIREIAPESILHKLIERPGLLRTLGNMFLWRDRGEEYLGDFETIITSGNEPLWYLPHDDQTVVAYTHSTPRHMYDRHHTRSGWFHRTQLQAQRVLYESNVRRPDLWVCNSDLVARRVRLYWGVPDERVTVVYPPTATETYSADAAPTDPETYLYFGRLVGHKRVDEVVRAFQGRDAQLIIAGKGDDRERLEDLAGPNVRFEGFVSEERKRELYAQAAALVYPPANEDFGMVPIEAFASGTPVIGIRDGFTRYQITDGTNGLLYDHGVENLRDALDWFERDGVAWDSTQLQEFAAANFGVERFQREMREVVTAAETETAIEPDWVRPLPDLEAETALAADGG